LMGKIVRRSAAVQSRTQEFTASFSEWDANRAVLERQAFYMRWARRLCKERLSTVIARVRVGSGRGSVHLLKIREGGRGTAQMVEIVRGGHLDPLVRLTRRMSNFCRVEKVERCKGDLAGGDRVQCTESL
jgi:hypothetical protein